MNFSENTSMSKLLFYVAQYQAVQKANSTDSDKWHAASKQLHALFAILAKKQAGV